MMPRIGSVRGRELYNHFLFSVDRPNQRGDPAEHGPPKNQYDSHCYGGGGIDPVVAGLVESLAHPGGNVTGLTNLTTERGRWT